MLIIFFFLQVNEEEDDKLEKKDSTGFSFGNAKPGSAHKRTLKTVQTHFFVGTEVSTFILLLLHILSCINL